MKLFAIAFGIVCGVAAVLFGVAFALLWLFQYPQPHAAAGALAGVVILAFPKVAEFLEQQESKKRLAVGRRKPVYDFRGFQIAWPLMVVYGTVVLSCLAQASTIIAGTMVRVAGGSFEGENAQAANQATGLLNTLITIFGAYLVGRWIGARSSRLGIVAILLMGLLTAVIWIGMDVFYFFPGKKYTDTFGLEGLTFFFGILMRLTVISLFIVVPGLIGYWRGQRQRLSKYLDYLLNVLPPQDRDTVVELAYGEAQKVAAAVGNVRPPDQA
jgi:hypothetical protein